MMRINFLLLVSFFCYQASAEVIISPGEKSLKNPSSYLEESFLNHASDILNKIIRKGDPKKIYLSISSHEAPVALRLKNDISISWGAMLALNYEDELAFLLVRALEGNPSFTDVEGCTRVMKRFILHTPYNPSAAVEYFEKMVRLTEALEAYGKTLEIGSAKESEYTNALMREQRELAKGLNKHYSWTEIDLSERIVDFKPFSHSVFTEKARAILYLSYLHYFYGPDYQKHIDWVTPFVYAGGTAFAVAGVVLFICRADSAVLQGLKAVVSKAIEVINPKVSKETEDLLYSISYRMLYAELLAIGGAVSYRAVNWYFRDPPELLAIDTKNILDLNTLLESRKGTSVTAEEVAEWIRSASLVNLGDADREYWLGKYVQAVYEKAVNLALTSKIELPAQETFTINPGHFKLIRYPLLVKFSSLFGYKKFSQERRLEVLEGLGGDKNWASNILVFSTAIRVLAEFQEGSNTEAEFKGAIRSIEAIDAQILAEYLDFLPDLAGHRCNLFFAFNAEDKLAKLEQGMRFKPDHRENLNQCLAREIARHSDYRKIIRQFNFLKKHFPDDEKTINLASRKLHSILKRYTSLKDFVSENPFSEDSTSFFELASSNGESLAENTHLICDLSDVHLVLETQFFWPYKKLRERDIGTEALGLLKSIRRASNGYNIELTEKLHEILYAKWKQLNPAPLKQEALGMWEKMVRRGTSIYSDQLFWEVYNLSADPEHRQTLEEYALEGLLHNQAKKKQLVMNRIKSSESFEKVKALNPVCDGEQRAEIISSVMESSRKALSTSTAHLEIMEAISKDIETTEQESALIEKGKYDLNGVGKEARDDSVDLITEIVNQLSKWPKERQWDFILFLVGHRESVDAASRNFLFKLGLTPLRLRDLFDAMPNSYQYTAVDALLNQRNGLLETIDLKEEWTRKVVDHLLSLVHKDARQIVEEMVDSYLEALNTPGMQYYRSTVFAHLLVSSKKGSQNASVLTETCKHFGTFGIKIGQFLLASGVLPEEENNALLNLEDNARAPAREKMYEDLREIFGNKPIPYHVKGSVGGASLKYVVRAESPDGRDVVLKILSKDALIHTKLEERLLKSMAAVLVAKYGQKYGIFKSAVHASAEAIKREINFDAEVKRSDLAREHMYKQCGLGVNFSPVKEALIHDRLIEAEYAPGLNIHRLEGNSKDKLAAGIVDCESKNFFAQSPDNDVIYFDPDRHTGNYRVTEDAVYPIDFGQLHAVTSEERARLIDLAAVAAIISKMGEHGLFATRSMIGPFVDHILTLFGCSHEKRGELVRALSLTFSQYHSETGLTPYYRLISIIEDAGLLDLKNRILCYDLPKGLLQLSRFGKLAVQYNSSVVPVEETYKSRVEARALELWNNLGKEPSTLDLFLAGFHHYLAQH